LRLTAPIAEGAYASGTGRQVYFGRYMKLLDIFLLFFIGRVYMTKSELISLLAASSRNWTGMSNWR
jgi:hypothetical protein